MTKTDEVLQIVGMLAEASDQYNNEGDSFLSDEEYDALLLKLKALDPTNIFLTEVGSEVRGGKVDLPYPMGSLDQVYEGETLEWVTKNGWLDEDFVVSDKQDGTSALNIHVNGELKVAYSRGNGFQGADITRHMSRIRMCPDDASGVTAAVRCEVIMQDHIFDELNTGERTYKNPRNYVAGKMNASESPTEFYENVLVIGTSIVDPKMGKVEQFDLMSKMGYLFTPFTVVKGYQLTDEWLTNYLEGRRQNSTTAIDGLVIDLDSAELRAQLRSRTNSINPPYSRKFKVGSSENRAIATVEDIIWTASKNGYLKPRVKISPVELVGVTINYCTGFNAKFIKDNELGPGAKIQITRSGDVIPYIEKVLEASPSGWSGPSEAAEWTETGVDLVVLDGSTNDEVSMRVIDHFFGSIGVDGLRRGSIEKLYSMSFNSVMDIIRASELDIQDAVGQANGSKIYRSIHEKLNGIELGVLAGATSLLGVGIGRRKMTKLCESIGNVKILNGDFTVDDIVAVDGFDYKTAETIMKNMPKFWNFMKSILPYVTIKEKEVMSGDLDGLVVVFTGIRDKELQAKIEARGGIIGSGVNKNTTYLVAKDPSGTSSKLVKARELIGEDKVISIVDARNLWG